MHCQGERARAREPRTLFRSLAVTEENFGRIRFLRRPLTVSSSRHPLRLGRARSFRRGQLAVARLGEPSFNYGVSRGNIKDTYSGSFAQSRRKEGPRAQV